jgi:hypothetical protein
MYCRPLIDEAILLIFFMMSLPLISTNFDVLMKKTYDLHPGISLTQQSAIQLLDEAVGTTPGSSLRQGTYRTPSNKMNISTPGKSMNLSSVSLSRY